MSGDQSKNEHNKSEESIKDIAQSTTKSAQQTPFVKQAKVSTPLTKQEKPPIIVLEGEWENFNKIVNAEEQSAKPPTKPKEKTMEMVIERVVNTQETEHIPIAPSSEIILRIEEITPLDLFYNP